MQKKKGISLIVLVITIIVMIILAVAIIISLNNSGIIGKANKTVQDTNEQEINHIASLAWSEAYLNGSRTEEELTLAVNTALTNKEINTSNYLIIVTAKGVTVRDLSDVWIQDGVNITKGNVTLEAGDLIQYYDGLPGTQRKWKVLGAEDGNLLIMSTENLGGSLRLYGLEGGSGTHYGLLNGISRLNTISSRYGTGTGAVGARSIKIEDIDKLTGYDKTTFEGNENWNYINKYGNEVTFSWDTSTTGKVRITTKNLSSTLYQPHDNGFSYVDFDTMTATTVAVNASGLPKLTNTGYTYEIPDTTLQLRSIKATRMLDGYNNVHYSDYWLASNFIETINWYVYFGLYSIVRDDVRQSGLFDSMGNSYVEEHGVRPVVKLSPDIKIGEKDDTLGWSFTI